MPNRKSPLFCLRRRAGAQGKRGGTAERGEDGERVAEPTAQFRRPAPGNTRLLFTFVSKLGEDEHVWSAKVHQPALPRLFSSRSLNKQVSTSAAPHSYHGGFFSYRATVNQQQSSERQPGQSLS